MPKKARPACYKASKNSLRYDQIRKKLPNLCQNYIAIPTDNTNSIVAISCKRFYILTLMKELRVTISNSNSNRSYEIPTLKKPNETTKLASIKGS